MLLKETILEAFNCKHRSRLRLLRRVYAEPEGAKRVQRRLYLAAKQISRNISAFSPEELEEMVRDELIEPKTIPPDLRTYYFVRHKIWLGK